MPEESIPRFFLNGNFIGRNGENLKKADTSDGPPAESYKRGERCKRCRNVLSIYNRYNVCSCCLNEVIRKIQDGDIFLERATLDKRNYTELALYYLKAKERKPVC